MFGLGDRFEKSCTSYQPGPGAYNLDSVFKRQKPRDLTGQLVHTLEKSIHGGENLYKDENFQNAAFLSSSLNVSRTNQLDESLTARVVRLEHSLNANRTPLCAPGRRRGGAPAPGVLSTSIHEVENVRDVDFQRHSWLAGELVQGGSDGILCFKGSSTPAGVGPGSYSLAATETFRSGGGRGGSGVGLGVKKGVVGGGSHNYLVQRSEEIST